MLQPILALLRPLALSLGALLLSALPAVAWERIMPHHFGRYHLPPSRFGYPLDDYSASYYGGGRYREYYSQIRGFGIANFPPPVPHDPYFDWVPLGILHGKHYGLGPALPVAPVPDNVGHLILHVPAHAEVWLEGQKMTQTGNPRVFVSPPLPPGQEFVYSVRVRWREQGEERVQTRTLSVRAGQRVTARFPEVDSTLPAALPVLRPVQGKE